MSDLDWQALFASAPHPETDADYATLRTLGRMIIGRSFPLTYGHPDDIGHPARTIWQIIAENSDAPSSFNDEGDEVELHQSPGGRVQVKARVVREKGNVAEIRFEKVTGRVNDDAQLTRLLNLDRDAANRLIDMCVALRGVDPAGGETVRIDEHALAAFLENPEALTSAYVESPERFKALIEADASASDVIAIAARRKTLQRFEELLSDPSAFEAEREGGTRESVWQRFFEQNPWLLGVGLSGQLLTAWDKRRLERVVAGHSVADVGKRVDALLTTSGIVRSLAFAEIKLHDDDLLESASYRPGTWAPSRALSGGIAQSLVTIERARNDLGEWLGVRDDDGFGTGEDVFSAAPRSFLIIGRLESLTRDGQVHTEKVRSFELLRANLNAPEILTYDEVLARARWTVDVSLEGG